MSNPFANLGGLDRVVAVLGGAVPSRSVMIDLTAALDEGVACSQESLAKLEAGARRALSHSSDRVQLRARKLLEAIARRRQESGTQATGGVTA